MLTKSQAEGQATELPIKNVYVKYTGIFSYRIRTSLKYRNYTFGPICLYCLNLCASYLTNGLGMPQFDSLKFLVYEGRLPNYIITSGLLRNLPLFVILPGKDGWSRLFLRSFAYWNQKSRIRHLFSHHLQHNKQ